MRQGEHFAVDRVFELCWSTDHMKYNRDGERSSTQVSLTCLEKDFLAFFGTARSTAQTEEQRRLSNDGQS